MIAYLPTPYPDELAFSWFSRYYVQTGCLTHKAALQELLAKRCNNPSKEFLGQLSQNAKSAIEAILPLEDAILNHTMFPQYARFLPAKERAEALHKLAHEVTDPNRLFGIQPRDAQERYLRYCPLCAAQDRAAYGEAYWHRKHQIRGMTVCTKHKCRLEDSQITAKSEQGFTLAPAELSIDEIQPTFVTDTRQLSYATFLEAVFDAPMTLEIPIRAVLFQGLRRTKYLKPSGRSRYTKALSDDLAQYFHRIGIPQVATMSKIQRTLLEDGCEFTVVCQLAFFLGMTVEELTAPILSQLVLTQEANTHYIANAKPVDWTEYDRTTAPLLEQLAQAVYSGEARIDGRPERLSERQVYRELGLLGHQLENMPMCRAIFDRYTESYPESWARKIIWAYQRLQKDGQPFYWSDIRKLSGVKKAHIQEIMPYIASYADAATAAAIAKLVGRMDIT